MKNNNILWKKIWHNEKYLVSNIGGLIKNEKNGKILSQRAKAPTKEAYFNGNSYLYVKLTLHKHPTKEYLVHRLVAFAWKKGYKPGLCVNHKDHNRYNNDANNVQWTTYSKNNLYKHKNLRQKAKKDYTNLIDYPF